MVRLCDLLKTALMECDAEGCRRTPTLLLRSGEKAFKLCGRHGAPVALKALEAGFNVSVKEGSFVTIDGQPVFIGGPGQGGGGASGGSASEAEEVPKFQVGITSARPGKPAEQVQKEMEEFRSMMEETPVENLSVQMGTGGWEGGEEPTFITSYDGNGEALTMLAKAGKKWKQKGVLVMREVERGGSPQTHLSFGKNLSDTQMKAIQDSMVKAGIGGWTWGEGQGGSKLMATCVTQWGGDASGHRKAMSKVLNDIKASGIEASMSEKLVETITMGPDNYDEFIP